MKNPERGASPSAESGVLRVPLANPLAENTALRAELQDAITRVLDSGAYILGQEVRAFEAEMSARLDGAQVVGVGTGTDALVLALGALGIGPGDEVIAPSHTAGPTVAAILMTGATPVLVDIDAATCALSTGRVAEALSDRTKAIIVVHLYGQPADMAALLSVAGAAGIPVIEDCAQAQGSRIGERAVGTFGTLACFSFYPTKNLGAIGDGGAVATSSPDLHDRLVKLRTYGWSKPQYAELPGGRCTRLDEIQAAILRVKLRHLDERLERRRAIAARYREGLQDLPLTLPQDRIGTVHSYHLYVVQTARRDALANALRERNIMTGIHYPFAVHQQPAFAAASRIPAPLAVTEAVVGQILSLPMYAELEMTAVERVIDALRGFDW